MNISSHISIIFSDHTYTFSRCSFERTYAPCEHDSLADLDTDLAICQHESSVTPANAVAEPFRN